MVYDSLLLNYGGGIIGNNAKSEQYKGSAALAIGLGGTGVAALSVLKGKIHQQLIADNPDSPISQYEGIQLLAIDSDEGDYLKYRGNCRLSQNEFLSIRNPQIAHLLRTKTPITNDPFMNWMDIDSIDKMLSADGAGGIRQVGRYLLMSNIDKLEKMLETKCSTALRSRGAQSLDIYIFAGISGGTGSGCFLDTCYIVRKIVENNGWNAKIMGYFFLPDVVTSKPAVANDAAARAYNEANGYAAMKELDYLMSLKDANDWFTQSYSATLKVHTQDAPVDMCHLVSARKSDGTLVRNGFTYGLNVATDYVMAYLADVKLEGGGDGADNGLTMRGHLANVGHGVDTLPRQFGANLSYHVMGACNAEIPMNQINTYLACGFYAKFMAAVGNERAQVSKSQVKDLCEKLRLTADLVKRSVGDKMPPLELIDVDHRLLAKSAMPAPGELNSEWAKGGNDWLDKCAGVMDSNIKALTSPLGSFEKNKINTDSLIGRVFQKLWDMALDPQFGPYFAAKLLKNNAYDIPADVTGSITTTDERVTTHRMYLDGARRRLEEAKSTFYRRSSKSNYADYMQAATEYYGCVYQVMLHERTSIALRKFYEMLQELYTKFFKPLTDMLDNLRDTFEENRIYLNSDNSADTDAYTWQIITFAEIEPMLKKRVEELSAKELVTDFVQDLLHRSDSWLGGDADNIAMVIRKLMLTLFKEESERSLQDYLVQKYPDAKDPKQLVDEIERDIMDKVHASAVPMFWCDQTFNLGSTFASNSLSVPAAASAICNAADNFKDHRPTERYTIRKTGIGDRIFALRLSSGVPLYAYQGITLLKRSYDQAENTPAGVGNHLYAKTGRGAYGSGHKDWRHFLPTPMPYSKKPDMIPEGPELLALYDEAERKGVIGQNEKSEYVIFISKDFTPKEYSVGMFKINGRFNMPAYEAELKALKDQIANVHVNCQQFLMKNDGDASKNEEGFDVVARCRKDYFLHYPLLQDLVRKELEKMDAMNKALEALEAIKGINDVYEVDMEKFCQLLFYKGITCLNMLKEEDYDKIARIFTTYSDRYGDTREFDLSNRKDSMKYGEDFPLYQAFLTYRGLDPKTEPRKEWDKRAEDLKNKDKTLEDLFIAYDLEQIWTMEAIDELKDKICHMNTEEAAAILRFYEELRTYVRELKDQSPRWPTKEQRYGSTGSTGSQGGVDPNKYWHVWDPTTGKQYVVYAQYGPTMAYDQTTGTWVTVRADMNVYNGTTWAPLKSDPFFANI